MGRMPSERSERYVVMFLMERSLAGLARHQDER
jgi:hypothetical protein